MFKSYFKTAYRNLHRHKNFSVINIVGLATGIAVCLIIFIVIQFELSFDNFHQKKDRIFRVLTEYHHADVDHFFYGPGIPLPMPEAMRKELPQIEALATVYREGDDQLSVLNEKGETVQKFKEKTGVFFTEPSFFDIFDYPMLAGNAHAALKDRNSVLLTKEIAQKYFGDWKTAMGKSLKWNNRLTLKVTGILATIPPNTDFQLKAVISYGTGPTMEFAKSTNWEGTGEGYGAYMLLKSTATEAAFNTVLRAFSKKHEPKEDKDSHIIQSLSKVHYDTEISNHLGKSISPQLIRTLWLIAGFILLIACVNFINLSTAQAVTRAKEVGVRKVLGTSKWQLKSQFMVETMLIVLAAITLSITIAFLGLPLLNKILDTQLTLSIIQNPVIGLFLLIMGIIVTLLAGFYPSIVLSGFSPVNALKSSLMAKNTGGLSLRRVLVVFQFVIAQGLIIATLIIVKQMNYFTHVSMGFDKTSMVNLPFPGDSASISKLDYLQNRLRELKGVEQVSFNSNVPSGEDNNWSTFTFNHAVKETDFYAIMKWTDYNYLKIYQLPLVAGRNLLPSDTIKEFLVNESLVKKLGFTHPEDVLNKEISGWNGMLKGPIVGVLKDFHNRSLRTEYAPLIMSTMKKWYGLANVKLASRDIPATMQSIEKIWNNSFPEFAFEYQFLDERIAAFYSQENRLAQLYKIFAFIAILLSSLGLYGLASFMTVQRTKEVGIRKVLGATASSIVYLFSKEFMLLIGIAFAIAAPIAWYFMGHWLQDYVYRIDLSVWIFMIGGAASIFIALVTISFQAFKAAFTNPIKSLRTE